VKRHGTGKEPPAVITVVGSTGSDHRRITGKLADLGINILDISQTIMGISSR